jgi:hypothetical protein
MTGKPACLNLFGWREAFPGRLWEDEVKEESLVRIGFVVILSALLKS